VIKDGFPALMHKFRTFYDPTLQEIYEYIGNTKAKSGNTLRFPNMSGAYKDKIDNVEFDETTGTFRYSKYGPKFNLWSFAPRVYKPIRSMVCLSLATSSWYGYKTGWTSWSDCIQHLGYRVSLPATVTMLLDYINYLHNWRKVKVGTIRSYLTALKKLHRLNHCSVVQFDHPDIEMFLKGLSNHEALNNIPGQMRNVMTFEVLKLWGCALQRSQLTFKDKLVFWTVSLLAFWSSARMGELLEKEQNSIDVIRVITWEKIKPLQETDLTIFLAVPKTSEQPEGVVVDIFSFEDKRYCAVDHLHKLYRLCREQGLGKPADCVFKLFSGDILTTSKMNYHLKKLLKPFLPEGQCSYSCHSFRAGLPSFMASLPDVFTEQDIQVTCRWKSEACRRYTRLHGIAQRRVMEKIHAVLK
jgi:hypothetical protein